MEKFMYLLRLLNILNSNPFSKGSGWNDIFSNGFSLVFLYIFAVKIVVNVTSSVITCIHTKKLLAISIIYTKMPLKCQGNVKEIPVES